MDGKPLGFVAHQANGMGICKATVRRPVVFVEEAEAEAEVEAEEAEEAVAVAVEIAVVRKGRNSSSRFKFIFRIFPLLLHISFLSFRCYLIILSLS